MASNPPPGMGGFFPGLFGDLLKMLQSDAPFPFELAEQLASTVALDGGDDANPDPVERIRLEALLKIAELHVADLTGISTTTSGRPITVAAVNRTEWARRTLRENRRLFERLAGALKPAEIAVPDDDPEIAGEDVGAAELLAKWTGAIAPAMVAMQFGSLVGHLARRTLGQYTLAIPRENGDDLAIVTENLSKFADDWSIPIDDLNLAILIRDVTTHVVLARPHVRSRLIDLLTRHAEGLQPSPEALEERLGEASDLGDIGSLMGLLGDPAGMGDLIDTPEFRLVRADLAALGASITGYVEWVLDSVGERTIGTVATIREALRRSRAALAEEDRGGDLLFSDITSQTAIDRGKAFVLGVLERGGDDVLAKLWLAEENLPTAAELDEPGAWLERLNLESLFGTETPETGLGETRSDHP